MTDEAMSPLRRRMIEDMTIRKLAPRTNKATSEPSGTSPRSLEPIARHGELRGCAALSLHLAASGADTPTRNHTVSALPLVAGSTQGGNDTLTGGDNIGSGSVSNKLVGDVSGGNNVQAAMSRVRSGRR